MTILLDDRIGSKDLAPYITPRPKLAHLEFGDASWIGNGPNDEPVCVGVERKRLKDFIESMRTGRLANHQLVGMSNEYHYSYVVVEGIWRYGSTGLIEIPKGKGKWEPLYLGSERFAASLMDNFANSLTWLMNCSVVFTPSRLRTGLWITNIHRWWTSKKWSQHRSCQGKVSHPLPVTINGKASLVARVAMELKGVGADRALKIGKRFTTIQDLCRATEKDLMQIDGIGKTVARGIIRELKGET